jgi:hypothetical protein
LRKKISVFQLSIDKDQAPYLFDVLLDGSARGVSEAVDQENKEKDQILYACLEYVIPVH